MTTINLKQKFHFRIQRGKSHKQKHMRHLR